MHTDLQQQLEALLFIAGKPLTYKKLSESLGKSASPADIKKAVAELAKTCQAQQRGVAIVMTEDKAQMVTHPDISALAAQFAKEEMQGELTKPSVETLAIVAYRGPVSKFELERIRGINCSLILRNLLLRGLIEARHDAAKREDYYSVSLEFLKHLGVARTHDLPDYERLHHNEDIDKFLQGEV